MFRPSPTILIAPEPFGCGVDVLVLPPPSGPGHDREFPTVAAARAYAADLSAAMGWPVADHCGADDGRG